MPSQACFKDAFTGVLFLPPFVSDFVWIKHRKLSLERAEGSESTELETHNTTLSTRPDLERSLYETKKSRKSRYRQAGLEQLTSIVSAAKRLLDLVERAPETTKKSPEFGVRLGEHLKYYDHWSVRVREIDTVPGSEVCDQVSVS